MIRKSGIAALAAVAVLSACVTDDGEGFGGGDGVLTHTDHSITTSERALVESTLASRLNTRGIQTQQLEASENLQTGAVTLCGYVSGISPAGTRSPNAVFGGMFSADRTQFMLFGGKGKGQDPNRIQQVRTMCGAAGIYL